MTASDAERVYRARPTTEEIADVLSQRLTAAVGTVNEDGSVHLAYVIFMYLDGRLYFETSSVTRKARNAAQREHLSMLIQGRAGTGRNLMVSAEGTARVIEGVEAQRLNHALRAKYIRPAALHGIDRAWGALDDVAIELEPQRWRSWTGSVLHEETRKHLDVPYEEAWITTDSQ
jgi:nitroimidazol reductase NimA-like FMN-containing flavoprotein (pyridoxamine 5'-phosphate oxidase superfamily)